MSNKMPRSLLFFFMFSGSLVFAGPLPADRRDAMATESIVLKELYNVTYAHLRFAQEFLRAMINCYQTAPLKRSDQSEPMYDETRSCAEIRRLQNNELQKAFSNMRINLALSFPGRHVNPIVAEQSGQLDFRFNPSPKQVYDGLPDVPPLSEAEIAEANRRWEDGTKKLNAAYDNGSFLAMAMDHNPQMNDEERKRTEREDEIHRYRFIAEKRANQRAKWFEAFTNQVSSTPLAAYLKKPLKGDDGPEDRATILYGLYEMLTNNCIVRLTKFKSQPASRSAINQICRSLVQGLRDHPERTLAQQDAVFHALDGILDRYKPIKVAAEKSSYEMPRYELLSVFGLHPRLVKEYKGRQSDRPEILKALESLEKQWSKVETVHSVGDITLNVGIGVACVVIFRRFPGLSEILGRFSLPLCLFATGLPVNTTMWIWGQDEYWQRFTETFSSEPGRALLQDLKAVSDAEFAQKLNTIFLGIGTGLPDVFKAAKPWIRILR